MDRTPVFPDHVDTENPDAVLRNFWCPHYDACLDEAAQRNLYLDCTGCAFKSAHEPDLFFTSNLP